MKSDLTKPGLCDWGPILDSDKSSGTAQAGDPPAKPGVPKAVVSNPGQSEPSSPSNSGID